MQVEAPGYPGLTIPIPFTQSTPMLETVADMASGGQNYEFNPIEPILDAETSSYCNSGQLNLEGAFVVDGSPIGWDDSFQSQVSCP